MPSAYDPRLTVIIPTWNRARLLERCLSSLARQRVSCPVLVVDNGSTDSTREMLETRFPGWRCWRWRRTRGSPGR